MQKLSLIEDLKVEYIKYQSAYLYFTIPELSFINGSTITIYNKITEENRVFDRFGSGKFEVYLEDLDLDTEYKVSVSVKTKHPSQASAREISFKTLGIPKIPNCKNPFFILIPCLKKE